MYGTIFYFIYSFLNTTFFWNFFKCNSAEQFFPSVEIIFLYFIKFSSFTHSFFGIVTKCVGKHA